MDNENLTSENSTVNASGTDPANNPATTTGNLTATAPEAIVFDAYSNSLMPDYDTKAFDEEFLKTATEIGLTKEQANALRKKVFDGDIHDTLAQEEENGKAYERDLNNLQMDWGNTYNFKINNINKLLDTMDGGNKEGPIHKYLQESGLDSDPKFVRFMDSIISNFTREDTTQVPKAQVVESTESIQGQINKLIQSDSYFNKRDPNHSATVNAVQALYSKLYSDEQY